MRGFSRQIDFVDLVNSLHINITYVFILENKIVVLKTLLILFIPFSLCCQMYKAFIVICDTSFLDCNLFWENYYRQALSDSPVELLLARLWFSISCLSWLFSRLTRTGWKPPTFGPVNTRDTRSSPTTRWTNHFHYISINFDPEIQYKKCRYSDLCYFHIDKRLQAPLQAKAKVIVAMVYGDVMLKQYIYIYPNSNLCTNDLSNFLQKFDGGFIVFLWYSVEY